MSNNIRPINIGEIENLAIDDDGRLYWKNQPVKLEKRFHFSWWQGFLAFIAALGSLLSGLMAVLEFF